MYWFRGVIALLGVALSCCYADTTAKPIAVSEFERGQSVTALAHVFYADSGSDNLAAVESEWLNGGFAPVSDDTISASMSQRPIWARLSLQNTKQQTLHYSLVIGTSWIDFIDVYYFSSESKPSHWRTGDEVAGAPYLEPSAGYVLDLDIPPGDSVVYVRAQSIDPLALTLDLISTRYLPDMISSWAHAYGVLYGFLLAFILYNLILFNALKQKRLLYYALYLLTFVTMNLSYTGRSIAWLWGEYPLVNRYALPFFMVMLPFAGLCFARSALELKRFTPRLEQWVKCYQWSGLLLLLPMAVFDLHEMAAWLAFGVLTLFIPLMVVLGVVMLRYGQIFTRYFLVAAIAAMAGSGITEFAIWGYIPFTPLTFHAMEIGMMLDATILAVGLSQHVRYQQKMKVQAEQLARVDSMTQLLNRRGFYDKAELQHTLALRHERPLSLIIVDIDHFKLLNDSFGHSAGDNVLIEFAQLLLRNLRVNDIAARWGGEEFVVLLPETNLEEARGLAERFRRLTQEMVLDDSVSVDNLTASFGVSEMQSGETLDCMISAADTALYQAKSLGRNRVEIAAERS